MGRDEASVTYDSKTMGADGTSSGPVVERVEICGAPPQAAAAAGAESTAGPVIPPLSPEPMEMVVKHKVIVRHLLIGNCPRCGAELATERREMIEAFEAGRTESSACQCGQLLSIPGKSMIVRANMGPNRHQRRAMGK